MAAPKPFAELLDERVHARFYAKVADEPDEHGCLLWLASVGTKGYGVFNLPGGSAIGAHRVAYVLAHGVDIPAELVIDHLCRVRRCVNPEHLRAVSNRGNLHAPGSEHWARTQREQTHCRRGHELAEDNLDPYQLARGRRQVPGLQDRLQPPVLPAREGRDRLDRSRAHRAGRRDLRAATRTGQGCG